MRISDWSSDVCSSDLVLNCSKNAWLSYDRFMGVSGIAHRGLPCEMATSSFTSVLLGPRLVAFCPHKVSASGTMIDSRGRLWWRKLISCLALVSRTAYDCKKTNSNRTHGMQTNLI